MNFGSGSICKVKLNVKESKSRRLALLQTPSKKFKGDSRYTGSDNEDDDFNDFKMNKGFIQSFSDT